MERGKEGEGRREMRGSEGVERGKEIRREKREGEEHDKFIVNT